MRPAWDFGLADQMREVGYTVKLHLGGKGPSDVDWQLEVHSQSPRLVLTDLTINKKYEMQSSEDLLEKLER